MTCPKTFNHYILNLPASAITFLPSFIGLYAGCEGLFNLEAAAASSPHQQAHADANSNGELPIVHVYCFSTKSDDNRAEEKEISERISKQLRYEMKPGRIGTEGEGEVEVWDVRDVAPLKRMFCASFRLPREVAFRVSE